MIRQIDHADVDRFIQFQFDLYCHCPQWVPPLWIEKRFELSPRHPFHENTEAAFFLAEQDGQVVGRIGVGKPLHRPSEEAIFYLFDCIEDFEIARLLIETALNWARSHGATRLRGPLSLITSGCEGMLTAGFQYPPALGMTYNYAYYPDFLQAMGFEVEDQIFSGYLDIRDLSKVMPPRVLEFATKVRQRSKLKLKRFATKREAYLWLKPRLLDIYNRTQVQFEGETLSPANEGLLMAREMLWVMDVELMQLLVNGNDELVGYLFCYPDFSEGLQAAGGILSNGGWQAIERARQTTTLLNINGLGVLPELQGTGAVLMMYTALFKTVKQMARRFDTLEVIQVYEKNGAMLKDLEKFGAGVDKVHQVLRRNLV